MTKREFVKKYPVKKTIKNMKVITALLVAGELTIFNFCEGIIIQKDIVRFSGRSSSTLRDWKVNDPFVYSAVFEKSVRCLVAEYEKCVEEAGTNFS